MTVDLGLIARHWAVLQGGVVTLVTIKTGVVYEEGMAEAWISTQGEASSVTQEGSMNLLRPYRPADRHAVLAVFRSNVPRSFTEAEEPDFLRFVDDFRGPYFVLEEEGRVVACGGIGVQGERVDLCWGMVEEQRHRQGLGLALTAFRLCLACEVPGAREVHLNTSNEMVGFYTRLGFTLDRTVKDAIRPGLDLLFLHLELTDASRSRLCAELGAVVRARLQLDPTLPSPPGRGTG
jgi:Acetyltransferase (GNAT) domain